jgi:hypothetical protein
MTGRDLFGVVVRSIGIYFIVTSAISLASLGAMNSELTRVTDHLVFPNLMGLAFGFALFMIADPIVNIAYRKTLEERVEIEKDRLFAEAQRIRKLEQDQ